jgi:uncharacterized protein
VNIAMGAPEYLLLAVTAFAASAINSMVGGGTLLTFGVLTALGYPPVVANGTSTTGVSLGSFASAWAYRSELRGRRLKAAIITTIVMSMVGAALVVSLPSWVFSAVVPWLILLAVALVAVQPIVERFVRTSAEHVRERGVRVHRDLPIWTGLVGLYGGYFGAGQGVMYMAALGLRYDGRTQHANAAKNLLSASANVAAGAVFIIGGAFAPWAALAIAIGGIAGGYGGARIARRLSDTVLRIIVIAVGLGAAALVVLS